MNKPLVLFIELGIKNIKEFKENINLKNINLIFESNFMNIVDLLYRENINVLLISDMRGIESTKNYIKFFKLKNPNFRIIIISVNEQINDDIKTSYLNNSVDGIFSYHQIVEIENFIKKLCDEISKEESFINQWSFCTQKSIRFIKDNYNIKDKLIDKLTESINYSLSAIMANVKKETGKSLVGWIRFCRVKGSISLLTLTELDVNSISKIVGYKSVIGFIKAFKKETGLTPKIYRRKNYKF